MKHNLNNLKKAAEHIRLSSEEKRTMHVRIFGLPAATSAKHAASQRSPAVSPYAFFSFRMAMSFGMALLVLVGSTTTYAAQKALPGDPLYPVKVRVTEPVQGALAFSSESKANFHVAIAEKRMEEAEALAAEDRLTTSTAKALEANLAMHVAAADSIATELSAEDPGVAAEVSARFHSSLTTHTAILGRLGRDSEDKDTRENSEVLALRVEEKVQESSRWRGRGASAIASKGAASAEPTFSLAQDTIIGSNEGTSSAKMEAMKEAPSSSKATSSAQGKSTAQRRAAAQVREKAQDALEEAKGTFGDMRRALDAKAMAQVRVELEHIEGTIEEGQELFVANEYAAAQEHFTVALEGAVKLAALIKASEKYNKNILPGLLVEEGRAHSYDTQTGENSERKVEIGL